MKTVFDQTYFDKAYGGDYEKRTPLRKILYYLAEIRRTRASGRLLDVGCAYGSFLLQARQYYTVAGLDISHDAVNRAKGKLPGVEVMQSDIAAFHGKTDFDVITCFDVLEHVRELDAAFETIRTLLREKGVLAAAVPVYDSLAGKAVKLLDKDKTHLWRESRAFWRKKLTGHGFRIITDHGLWRYSLLGRYYLFWGGKRWRDFSPAILLIGEKK